MNYKLDLFSQNQGLTFAESIDLAYEIYLDFQKTNQERQYAQNFLIYAFDIQKIQDLNWQLVILMNERIRFKAENPEYIPGFSPKHLQLHPAKMLIPQTRVSKQSSDAIIQRLMDENELIDVSEKAKKRDETGRPLFFNNKERACYRVHIHKAKFFQSGKVFDTKYYVTHLRQGYASFTLNANGELSIFSHLTAQAGIVHASMNAGSPLVSAGELCIREGELISIITYSGHYTPNMFNAYRALTHFSRKGINIAATQVLTKNDPRACGLTYKTQPVEIYSPQETFQFYGISALEFVDTVRMELNKETLGMFKDIPYDELAAMKRAY